MLELDEHCAEELFPTPAPFPLPEPIGLDGICPTRNVQGVAISIGRTRKVDV